MRLYFTLFLLLAFVSLSLGQTPSDSPTTQSNLPVKTKIKDFGASLKKFGKKGKDNSKNEKRPTEGSDEEIIRVKTDLIVCDVLVVNQKGNVILGLDQNDFVVTEDGEPQKISLFSFGENATIPRSIVLIIDYSSSQLLFLRNSIEAAKILIDKLAPQDRMAIVTDDVKLLTGFTKDKALLKKELDNLGKNMFRDKFGRSEQYSALVATLNEMFDEEDIRPIVIFQTDEDELFYLKGAEKMPPSFYQPAYGGVPQKNLVLMMF